jgi:glycosyltransferase involved in cell wall biosynthesis
LDEALRKIKVTIVLSTYNGIRYLGPFLESLEKQTRKPDRIVLRDDGSTDNSIKVVSKWARRKKIKLTVIRGRRVGPAKSFLAAISKSEPSDIYFLADQDDVWLPEKIARAVELISAGKDDQPILYGSRKSIVDKDLKHLYYTGVPHTISFEGAVCDNVITGCTMAFNRKLACLASLYVPENAIMHDWWLYLLTTGCGGKVIFDEVPNILYRQHGSNTMGAGPRGFALFFSQIINPFSRSGFNRGSQLQEFFITYKNYLTPSAKHICELLLEGINGIIPRIKAAICCPLSRKTFFTTLKFRLRILLGRY